MKSVLLYANDGPGFEARLRSALDVVRLEQGHLLCLQVTPYDAFTMGDAFGGVYALPTIVEQVKRTGDEHRSRVEARLREEGASFDWASVDGAPAQMIVEHARLSDLIVLSLPDANDPQAFGGVVADVLVHARSPILAVPQESDGFDVSGAAMVAWDGSLESSHALRLTLPMLRRSASVAIVTVGRESEHPAQGARDYLARHGIEAEEQAWPLGEGSLGEALLAAARSLEARYIVMGAYGHTRLREAVLGGTTREMLHRSGLPLLLAH